jgi:hypothetical protein
MSPISSPYDPPTKDTKLVSPKWPKPIAVTFGSDFVLIYVLKGK